MKPKLVFVLIEKDHNKAESLTGISPDNILNSISDKDVCEFLYNNGFTIGEIELQTAPSVQDFLGIPVNEVHNAWETNSSDIILPKRLPKWICLDTRTKDNSTLGLPFIYPDYLVRKRHESGTYYPILKKMGDQARYILFHNEEGNNLELYISLLKDILAFFLPSIQYVLSDNQQYIEYWKHYFMNNYSVSLNVLPYYFSRFYPDEQIDFYIDLNSCKIRSIIGDIYNMVHDLFSAQCNLFYTDLTQNVILNITEYLETIANDTQKFHKFNICRYETFIDSVLSDNNNTLPLSNNEYNNITGRWINIYRNSPSLKDYFNSNEIFNILYVSERSKCNLLIAVLNLVSQPGYENICEISIRASLNGNVLLENNLLGLLGFYPAIDNNILSFLHLPELNIITRKIFYKEVEIEINILHYSDHPVYLNNEEMYRIEAYAQLWVSEKLGNRLEIDMVRFCSSQIMLRNLSHNIGSHMLLNLQSQTEKIMSECFSGTEVSSIDKVVKHMHNVSLGLEYIRLKSDYLSAFAFSGTGVSFHNTTVMEIKKLLDKYTPVFNLLPDKLIDVKIDVQVNGIKVDDNNNINISLPLGGEFALLNILENNLRNFIKHEKISSDFIEIVINFGGKHSMRERLSSDEVNVQIYRKGSIYDEKKCQIINRRIDESIIDQYSRQLNYNNLGLKEIKGAVLFLLGISPGEWEIQPSNPYLSNFTTKAHLTSCRMENEEGPLMEWGYLFQVKRSHTILAVFDSDEEVESYRPTRNMIKSKDKNTAKRLDIAWERIDNLEKKLTRDKNKIVSYDFIVFSGIPDSKRLDFIKNVPDNRLPLRKVVLDLNKIDKNELEEKVWAEYYRQNSNKVFLYGLENIYPCYITSGNKDGLKLKPCSYNHNLPYEPKDFHGISGRKDEISQFSDAYPKYYYVEALSSESQKTSPLYSYKSLPQDLRAVKRYLIMDYTTFPVFIIDERIQRIGIERQLFAFWKLMGIFVPEEKELDSAEFPEEYISKYIQDLHHPLPGFKLKRGKSALVIHESLLQRWVGSEHVADKINELKNNDISVYLTTGRGKSQYLSENEHDIRFVPFSIVYTCCCEVDKYKLYTALQSARI